MKSRFSFCIFFLAILSLGRSQLPVRFDNEYKTIFAKDLCKLASNNPDLLLLDVRSPGEFRDTSSYNSLNMGHLKSAINIPIDTILKNIAVLTPFKDKTLVLYCSHSQRSRRVSLLLSKNGFKNFYNLNGGMSQINQMGEKEFPCKKDWFESNLGYANLSTKDAIKLLESDPKPFILDVRPAAVFSSRDSLIQNNIGRIKSATNIPYTELKHRLNELPKEKRQAILIYGQSGDGDAARTAIELKTNGFSKVFVLLAGLDDLLSQQNGSHLVEYAPLFKLLDARGAIALLKDNNGITIYDVRPKIEYENKKPPQEYYLNLGNIKNAINIEEKDFSVYNYPKEKKTPILIYGRGEAYKLAQKLSGEGYEKIYVMRGLYDFVSSAFNVEGCRDALLFLENHDGFY